jgi:hypothetical protein
MLPASISANSFWILNILSVVQKKVFAELVSLRNRAGTARGSSSHQSGRETPQWTPERMRMAFVASKMTGSLGAFVAFAHTSFAMKASVVEARARGTACDVACADPARDELLEPCSCLWIFSEVPTDCSVMLHAAAVLCAMSHRYTRIPDAHMGS